MPQAPESPDLLRKQALKLNDEVLQGLVVAKMAFENGDHDRAGAALADSLERLRETIDQMLAHGAGPEAGDFVRGHLMGRMDD
jgi:hypothetical protein